MTENTNKTIAATLENCRYAEFLKSPIFSVVIRVPRNESNTGAATWDDDFINTEPTGTTESESDEPAIEEEPAALPSTSIFNTSKNKSVEGPRGISKNKKPEAAADDKTAEDAPATVTYIIHKSLLESVSREMRSHIRNAMREGLTNTMHLSDVLPDTFDRFVEWAYTKDYPYDDETTRVPERDDSIPSILVHARLFVFAERFNIVKLRALARERIEKLLEALVKIKDWAGETTVGNLIQAWQYLFDNLPIKILEIPPLNENDKIKPVLPSNQLIATTTKDGDVEAVLRVVVGFSFDNAQSMRKHDTFRELVLGNTEFALAMVDRIGVLTSNALDACLRQENWNCGRCFNKSLNIQGQYRSRVSCSSCGQKVGPTLAE